MSYQFQYLPKLSKDVLDQIERIYNVSFPRQERKPFWFIVKAVENGRYNVFVMTDEQNNEVIAFALLVPLAISRAAYIEYLAVSPALRSKGIGAQMWQGMVDFYRAKSVPAIVWEVDPPKHPDDPKDDDVRRIRFYERLGAHLIEESKNYGMPNYFVGHGIFPLLLMWAPLLQNDLVQPTREELIAFITDIYDSEYHGHDSIRDEIIANLDK